MVAICNSYIVPFNPLGAPGPTILTAAQNYNRAFKCLKRGSTVTVRVECLLTSDVLEEQWWRRGEEEEGDSEDGE